MADERDEAAGAFARRLAGLTPATTIARDRVLYEAGRAAGRKADRPWRIASTLLIVGLMGFSAHQTQERRALELAALAPRESAPRSAPGAANEETSSGLAGAANRALPPDRPSAPTTAPVEYMRLRDLALAQGAEAMPEPGFAGPLARSKSDSPLNEGNDGGWRRRRLEELGGNPL